jgi:anti-sigma regulatory factor (Ser/Thr protein kinase)
MTGSPPPAGQDVYLILRMRPPWVFIDELRRFVESFCACACPDANREAQLALAVHELTQNAVHHGEEIELKLEVDATRDRVSVSVTNPCTDETYAALAARLDRMNDEKDALAHYLTAMRETPVSTRGGLGLARVRFEAQLELSVSRNGGELTVHASGPLRAPMLQIPGGMQ